MSETMQRLFRYKAWADDQLLTPLAKLGGESPVTGLALKALSHSYVVDQIFMAHLRGSEHAFTSANLADMPSLYDLSAELRASDKEYVDYVSGLDSDAMQQRIDFTFTDGAAGRMSREEMLLHVITHGVGHRGQVSAVMLLNSLTPPPGGFTTYLHIAESNTRRRAVSPRLPALTG